MQQLDEWSALARPARHRLLERAMMHPKAAEADIALLLEGARFPM